MSALPPRQKIVPCLWFDKQAEEAARFYVSLLPDSRIDAVIRSPGDYPSGQEGEAVSLQIDCEDQAEVDRLTEALSAVPEAEQCGWVKDRYGLSWQIVPYAMTRLLADPDEGVRKRVFNAMMEMKRLNIAELERAARG